MRIQAESGEQLKEQLMHLSLMLEVLCLPAAPSRPNIGLRVWCTSLAAHGEGMHTCCAFLLLYLYDACTTHT